jgi:hypothetical protein
LTPALEAAGFADALNDHEVKFDNECFNCVEDLTKVAPFGYIHSDPIPSVPIKVSGERDEDFIKREIKFKKDVDDYIHEVSIARVEFTERSELIMQQRVELIATQVINTFPVSSRNLLNSNWLIINANRNLNSVEKLNCILAYICKMFIKMDESERRDAHLAANNYQHSISQCPSEFIQEKLMRLRIAHESMVIDLDRVITDSITPTQLMRTLLSSLNTKIDEYNEQAWSSPP